jgi:hypothetical protein
MRKIYCVIIVLTFVILFGCSTDSKKLIEFDDHIAGSFNKEEKKELSTIIYEFEKFIPSQFDNGKEKYLSFFELISNAKTAERIISISDSLFNSYDFKNSLSNETFSKIWEYNDISFSKSLSLKQNSPFTELLKNLASVKGGIIKDYYESFGIAGDLSPSMVAIIQKQYDQLDISDNHVRLVLAIHYLTLSKQKVELKRN